MRSHSISAFALALALFAYPAYALDVGIGGSVGGVSVGVDVGVDSGGVSVGADVDAGGVGSVDVDASAGTDGVSGNVGAGPASPSTGGTTAGAGAAAPSGANGATAETEAPTGTPADVGDIDASGGAKSGATTRKPDAAVATTATKPVKKFAKGMRRAISLPPLLRPTSGRSSGSNAFGYPPRLATPLPIRPGVAPALVRACRLAIASAARPLGAVRVEAASAGSSRRIGRQVSAPLNVRIQYARQGGIETRQAKISCRLGTDGQVVAVR